MMSRPTCEEPVETASARGLALAVEHGLADPLDTARCQSFTQLADDIVVGARMRIEDMRSGHRSLHVRSLALGTFSVA